MLPSVEVIPGETNDTSRHHTVRYICYRVLLGADWTSSRWRHATGKNKYERNWDDFGMFSRFSARWSRRWSKKIMRTEWILKCKLKMKLSKESLRENCDADWFRGAAEKRRRLHNMYLCMTRETATARICLDIWNERNEYSQNGRKPWQ